MTLTESKLEAFNAYISKQFEPERIRLKAQSVVCGTGSLNAKLMLIGDTPRHADDSEGIPFAGRSGDILDKILERSGFNRENLYLTNLMKVRPTNKSGVNRAVELGEIELHKPFLMKEIRLVNPKVIVTLGEVATRELLSFPPHNVIIKSKFKFSQKLGMPIRLQYIPGITVVPMYHPSYLLQVGKAKFNEAVETFRFIKEILLKGDAN